MWESGVPTFRAVENPYIIYIDRLYMLFLCVCASSVSVVPHLWIQPTMDCVVG